MEQTIKAIETEYKGYRFRSRLEARWAVFFDALKLEWEYEKEGYTLKNGINYLPDFWIPLDNDFPDKGHFIEIKAQKPNIDEIDKMIQLAESSWGGVYCFWNMTDITWNISYFGRDPGHIFQNLIYDPQDVYIREEIPTRYPIISFPFSFTFFIYPDFHKKQLIDKALKAARSARFEFGEAG